MTIGEISDARLKVVLGFAFGFFLLAILGFLTIRVALGHVEEATSYGLHDLILVFGMLASGFVQWAFGARLLSSSEEKESGKQ